MLAFYFSAVFKTITRTLYGHRMQHPYYTRYVILYLYICSCFFADRALEQALRGGGWVSLPSPHGADQPVSLLHRGLRSGQLRSAVTIAIHNCRDHNNSIIPEGVRCQTFSFSFFPCSADHERDWPPCKVVFSGWQPIR